MKRWKHDTVTGATILEQFLADYKLTNEEGAKALGTNSRTLNAIKEDINKAEISFIENFCMFTGYNYNELFENDAEDTVRNLIEIPGAFEKVNLFQKSFLEKKSSLGYSISNEALIFSKIHKPIISFIGDSFAEKNICFKNTIPQLSLLKKTNLPVYLFSDNDCSFPQNQTMPMVVTPSDNKFFEPTIAFDPDYITSCKITNFNDKMTFSDNSVIIVKSDFPLLKNCIMLFLPDIMYEESLGKITLDSLSILVNYLPYSDIIVFFDAITRLLTISETPLIQYLLNYLDCSKKLLFVATKKDLKPELARDFGYIDKQKEIQNKQTTNTYDKAFSFKPLEPSQVETIQEMLFFYDNKDFFKFINILNEKCNSLSEGIIKDIIDFGDFSPYYGDNPELRQLVIKTNDEIAKSLKKSFDDLSKKEIIKRIIETDDINLGKKGLESFIIFIQMYSSKILEDIPKMSPLVSPEKVRTNILPECNLYIGNLILPMIREKKSFSKGTSETWAKIISKKIKNTINSEYFKSFTTIVKRKNSFDMRYYI